MRSRRQARQQRRQARRAERMERMGGIAGGGLAGLLGGSRIQGHLNKWMQGHMPPPPAMPGQPPQPQAPGAPAPPAAPAAPLEEATVPQNPAYGRPTFDPAVEQTMGAIADPNQVTPPLPLGGGEEDMLDEEIIV